MDFYLISCNPACANQELPSDLSFKFLHNSLKRGTSELISISLMAIGNKTMKSSSPLRSPYPCLGRSYSLPGLPLSLLTPPLKPMLNIPFNKLHFTMARSKIKDLASSSVLPVPSQAAAALQLLAWELVLQVSRSLTPSLRDAPTCAVQRRPPFLLHPTPAFLSVVPCCLFYSCP